MIRYGITELPFLPAISHDRLHDVFKVPHCNKTPIDLPELNQRNFLPHTQITLYLSLFGPVHTLSHFFQSSKRQM